MSFLIAIFLWTSMNILQIPYVPAEAVATPAQQQAYFQSRTDWQPIGHSPWAQQYPYTPVARFRMAWNEAGFYLYYEVQEAHVRADFLQDQDPVFQESCVEFFLSPTSDQQYYNFEFNAIGTCLAGCKTNAHKGRLPQELTEQILRLPSLPKGQPYEQRAVSEPWTLSVMLPASVIGLPALKEGMQMRANFYKCGDKLDQPHFLCWSPIKYAEPSFHRPEFFGKVMLVR